LRRCNGASVMRVKPNLFDNLRKPKDFRPVRSLSVIRPRPALEADRTIEDHG
jgi:hypothetical protein